MLIDSYGRKIDYLRISVTDRCNMRCVYCMPAEGILHKTPSQILSFEQIYKIANVAAKLGMHKIRITGGEPLVRKDLPTLISKLRSIPAIKEIALTTNGVYLSQFAPALKMAGLDRINISLDSLIPEKFHQITRGGNLEEVLEGIKASLLVSLSSIKINTVLIKGFNDDEILDFARLAKEQPLHIRFIEYMATRQGYLSSQKTFFSCVQAKAICQNLGTLSMVKEDGSSTATVFNIEGFSGTIGFISPISQPFCFSCNKLRLTADGFLRSCLHSSKAINLKQAIKEGATDEMLVGQIKKAVALKPASHNLPEEPLCAGAENFSMCQIGG